MSSATLERIQINGIFQSENGFFSRKTINRVTQLLGNNLYFTKDGKSGICCEWRNLQPPRTQKNSDWWILYFNLIVKLFLVILYKNMAKILLKKTNGIFAFSLLWHWKRHLFNCKRSHGICLLYQGWDKSGNYFIVWTESFEGVCNKIETFYQDISFTAKTDKNFNNGTKEIGKSDFENVKDNETSIAAIRKGLEDAVTQNDEWRSLWSFAFWRFRFFYYFCNCCKICQNRTKDEQEAWYPRLHSFAVGLEGSPDLVSAQKAENILVLFTTKSIYRSRRNRRSKRCNYHHLETYDVNHSKSFHQCIWCSEW